MLLAQQQQKNSVKRRNYNRSILLFLWEQNMFVDAESTQGILWWGLIGGKELWIFLMMPQADEMEWH